MRKPYLILLVLILLGTAFGEAPDSRLRLMNGEYAARFEDSTDFDGRLNRDLYDSEGSLLETRLYNAEGQLETVYFYGDNGCTGCADYENGELVTRTEYTFEETEDSGSVTETVRDPDGNVLSVVVTVTDANGDQFRYNGEGVLTEAWFYAHELGSFGLYNVALIEHRTYAADGSYVSETFAPEY